MTPNVLHQSGSARAYIKQDPFSSMAYSLFVSMDGNYVVTLNDGQMIVNKVPEGTAVGSDQALLTWSMDFDETVVDIFKAICKSLDLYSDDPTEAYKRGLAEGESKVLREWLASVTK